MGLHYSARYLKAGFAVPLWELARDPNVWEYGILFRPNPKPEWMQLWNNGSRTTASDTRGHHENRYDFWTDQVPIDWTNESARRCEQRLSSVVSPESLQIFMENIGIAYYIKPSSSPREIWRDALNTAANRAKLRLLIKEIANAEEYFAIRIDLLSLINSDDSR